MIDPAQIRAARGLLNWTQSELALRAGVSRRLVIAVEKDAAVVDKAIMGSIVASLEAAGVEFFSERGRCGVSGPGHRGRKGGD